jgi:hypothetical protein
MPKALTKQVAARAEVNANIAPARGKLSRTMPGVDVNPRSSA